LTVFTLKTCLVWNFIVRVNKKNLSRTCDRQLLLEWNGHNL